MSDIEPAVPEPDIDLLALHDALGRLEAADKRKADLVKLRFFVGLTIEEAAHASASRSRPPRLTGLMLVAGCVSRFWALGT